jgi:hypothetical protein
LEDPEAAKGFVAVGALKLKPLDDGAAKVCCCTPLTPFAPKVGVAEFAPGKRDGVDWVVENEGPVGAGLVPGFRLRMLPFASRILRLWSVSGQRCGMTRAEAEK